MIRKWLRQRLGFRLAMVCFVMSLGIALAVTAFQVYRLNQLGTQQANQLLTEVEQSFIPALTDALWTLDPVRLNTQIDAIKQLPTFGQLQLTDESGVLVRQLNVMQGEALAQRSYPLVMTIEQQRFELGTLSVVLDNTSLDKRMFELTKISLATSFAVALVSSLVLVWLFHHWVGVQLQQVSLYASQLNAQNLSSPLVLNNQSAPDDEIGRIVMALTNMQTKLLAEFERRAEVETELKAYQSHLETMVDDRTQQLAVQTQELESQSYILVEQNAELNAFAHTVAHDLKHPISSLIGISTLLSQAFDSLDKTQQHAFLEQILQSSLKMNAMINGLLQLASLRADEKPEMTEVDIQSTVQGALKNLSTLIEQYQPAITVAANLPTVLGHAQWIEEIWLNYISNAIKYGGEPACITIGFATDAAAKQQVFWVEDRGTGLAPEQAAALFTEFSRLHMQRSDSHGLGLSIVRRICHKLGGQCGYKPGAEGGSHFWFSLPI